MCEDVGAEGGDWAVAQKEAKRPGAPQRERGGC